MNEDTIAVTFRTQLDNMVNRVRFRNVDISPEKVIIFIAVGSSDIPAGYAESINEYARTIMVEHSTVCILFDNENPDSLKSDITGFINTAATGRTVGTARNLFIIPVLFQDSDNEEILDNVFTNFREAYNKTESNLRNINYNIMMLTNIVMFRDYNYICSKKAETESCNHNSILFRDYDIRGFVIKKESLVRTIVMAAVMLSGDEPSIVKFGENRRFSAGSLTLCMPVHIKILKRIKEILEKFISAPENHEERMVAFGKTISERAQSLLWNNYRDELPADESGKISIEPVYSLNIYEDFENDVNIENFIDEYYLSKMPVNNEFINRNTTFTNMFWDSYKEQYGHSIYGINEIFSQGREKDFIDKYITLIEVSAPPVDNCSTLIEQKAARLKNDISGRIKKVYDGIMRSSSTFVRNTESTNQRLRKFIEKLLSTVNTEISGWKGIEIEDGAVMESDDIDNGMIMELMNFYIDSISNAQVNEEEFMNKVCEIANRNFSGDVTSYFSALKERCNDTERRDDFVKQCINRTENVLPAINTNQNSAVEWHFAAGDNENSSLFTALTGENRNAGVSVVHRFSNMNDRIEILCFRELRY